MTDQFSINDLGVDLVIAITEDGAVVDISTATTLELVLKRPGGTEVTKTASFYTDGTDGKIKYQTLAGDIDAVGLWEMKAKVTFSPTKVYYSYGELADRQFRVTK